jgi:hypothetical protein
VLERADSALSRLVREMGMENALRLHRIKARWDDLFGEPLSSHIYPARLEGGQLLVNADSPAWLQQTSFFKAGIIEKLCPFGVKDVRLRMGAVRRRQAGRTPRERPLSEADSSFIEDLLRSVRDEDLKESIRRALRKWARSATLK